MDNNGATRLCPHHGSPMRRSGHLYYCECPPAEPVAPVMTLTEALNHLSAMPKDATTKAALETVYEHVRQLRAKLKGKA